MGMLAELFFNFVRRNPQDDTNKKSDYIFYKIVEVVNEEQYTLQCINTKATFRASITDIIFDIDILYSLHPIQSCYVGIEYAKFLKQQNDLAKSSQNPTEKFIKHPVSRYGYYSLCHLNRNGHVCFINKETLEEVLMDPRDIALSEELIQEFDAVQAFYIGLLAGLKIHNPIKKKHKKPLIHRGSHLRLIKS